MAGSQGDSWVIFRRYTDFCRLSDKVRRYRAPQQLHISKAAYTFILVKWRAVRSPERLEGVDYIWQMLQHLSISDYYFARPVLTNNIFPHAVKGWFSCMWMCMWIGLRAATICCLICSVRSLCWAHMLHPWIGENITWIKDNTATVQLTASIFNDRDRTSTPPTGVCCRWSDTVKLSNSPP